MTTNTTPTAPRIHPYFIAQASAIFARAGGDPARAGALARWAQEHVNGNPSVGVIVGRDGTILAETIHQRYRTGTGATYVTSTTVVAARKHSAGVVDYELAMAMGALRRITHQDVLHVRHSEVCRGAGRYI